MNTAAAPYEALLPRPPDGLGRGALLALMVHAGLVVALTAGVQWRATAPAVVSAELWAAVPQAAAPRPVEKPPPAPAPTPAPTPAPQPPPPVQREAQIATERAQRDKAEREALQQAERQRAAEAARQREQEQRARQAEDKRLAQQREQNLARLRAQMGTGAPGSTGEAAREAGPSASYAGRLIASIKPNIVFGDTLPGNPAAEVEVRAAPSGTILSKKLVKSSGHPEWDDAVLRAIERTGTLPRDTDGRVPATLIVTFRPND
jgi:colicin import membrane protein